MANRIAIRTMGLATGTKFPGEGTEISPFQSAENRRAVITVRGAGAGSYNARIEGSASSIKDVVCSSAGVSRMGAKSATGYISRIFL